VVGVGFTFCYFKSKSCWNYFKKFLGSQPFYSFVVCWEFLKTPDMPADGLFFAARRRFLPRAPTRRAMATGAWAGRGRA
jgi:hypothetical protein